MKILKNRRGFTLVELIVVLVILAILAALLIPALTGYIDKAKRDQVVSETRMLHEAVQTVASEAYASNEWQSDEGVSSIITIASQSGKKVTNFEDNGTYDIFKNRYSEVVKLAEVPSLTDGDGDFVAMLDQKGSVFCLPYNTGRGLLGAYYKDTGEYTVYDTAENISNYKTHYGNYKNAVVCIDLSRPSGLPVEPWSKQYIDAMIRGVSPV